MVINILMTPALVNLFSNLFINLIAKNFFSNLFINLDFFQFSGKLLSCSKLKDLYEPVNLFKA